MDNTRFKFIPAIDIIDGRCVRLKQGDFNQMEIYHNDPVEVALRFEGLGCQFLHLVDLDGAKHRKLLQYNILEAIASKTSLSIDLGGGIYSDDDIRIAFECGAEQVTAGSMAIKSTSKVLEWADVYGSQAIILGMDIKAEEVYTGGWTENSGVKWNELLERFSNSGIRQVICTDISKDGMMSGPAFKLYQKIKSRYRDWQIIASGGVGHIGDVNELLEAGEVGGVIVGKAIYEQKISDNDIQSFNLKIESL